VSLFKKSKRGGQHRVLEQRPAEHRANKSNNEIGPQIGSLPFLKLKANVSFCFFGIGIPILKFFVLRPKVFSPFFAS
jgi:hypothetical protein